MKFFGEELLIKLLESLADKGVGSLLEPWQIRRVGRATADAKSYEMRTLADASREVDEIRSGRLRIENGKCVLYPTANSSEGNTVTREHRCSPLVVASRAVVADAVRKEVNVAKAILHAEGELREDTAAPREQKIDEDWLYRWRDYAGSVSSDELQAIWGKILAGELKSPGQYSYRLMDFVRNLTTEEANLIEKIAPFVTGDFIDSNLSDWLEENGVSFSIFIQLQELGIISGVGSYGVTIEFTSESKDRFRKLLRCHGRGLIVEHDDPNKMFFITPYSVTSIGVQVIKLGKFVPNEKYLKLIGERIQKDGFKVSLGDCADFGNGKIMCSNVVAMPNA